MAETQFAIAQEQGEAKTAMATAEQNSNTHLLKSRQFELRAKRLDV